MTIADKTFNFDKDETDLFIKTFEEECHKDEDIRTADTTFKLMQKALNYLHTVKEERPDTKHIHSLLCELA